MFGYAGLPLSHRGVISWHTGISKDDILVEELHGEALGCPRYYIAVDHEHRALVVTVRGTANFTDVVTDMAGLPVPFLGGAYVCVRCDVLSVGLITRVLAV